MERREELKAIENLETIIMFYHIREPKGIRELKTHLPEAKTLLIRHPGDTDDIPPSDLEVFNLYYDYEVADFFVFHGGI